LADVGWHPLGERCLALDPRPRGIELAVEGAVEVRALMGFAIASTAAAASSSGSVDLNHLRV
jgi:hypothetical protein